MELVIEILSWEPYDRKRTLNLPHSRIANRGRVEAKPENSRAMLNVGGGGGGACGICRRSTCH